MGAIKLPVRVDTVAHLPRFFALDADNRILCIIDSSEEANELATALNERPALIAERDGLRERVAELEALLAAPVVYTNGSMYIGFEIPGRGGWSLKVGDYARPFVEAWDEQRRAALRTGGK